MAPVAVTLTNYCYFDADKQMSYSPLALQHILHVEATTSRVPVAAASIKSGFVMERMTVKIMQMKKAVVCIH